MKKDNIESLSGQTLFVGIEVHKKSFHVTFRTFDCEISSQSIPASWSALKKRLRKSNGSVLSSKRKMLIPAKILCLPQAILQLVLLTSPGSLRCPLEWKILCGAKSIKGLPLI